jgi:DNA topoisomerase-1
MKLVVVESPTKARTLERFLKSGFQTIASMGHIRDLPKKTIGIDIKNDFKPEYVWVEAKKETIDKLKKEAKKAEQIILATDPDREGEAIAYHVAQLLKKGKKNGISRIVFHEITSSAVFGALESPKPINKKLVDAQQARRVLDRLVGYKLSPLLWKKIRNGLSAGRVQSPALRLIVEREKEIKDFKPKEFWEMSAKLKNKSKKSLTAQLVKIKDKKAEINNKKEADKVIKDLKKASYLVEKVKKRTLEKSPPAPFITSTLQRSASSIFHWSAKRTMTFAQRLYEHGYITYHRTDSTNLSKQAVERARKYIKEKFGDKYLPESARVFKTKSKLAQEAHEAIRPTSIKRKELTKVSNQAKKLYSLISNRFLASQMAEQRIEKDTIDIKADDYLFRAVGEKTIFPGWRAAYKKELKVIEIPTLNEGEKLNLIEILPEQKFTQPPARYTEGSLIRALESRGIGRPSTYATIIATIKARKYIEKIERYLQPTAVGTTVSGFLEKYFPSIVDYDFTAEMEDSLDNIAKGEKQWVPVIKEFYTPFDKKLKEVAEKAERQKIKAEKTGEKCPKCKKGDQVIRIGKFGKFLACSRFPKCKWTEQYVEKVGKKCQECDGEIIVRQTEKGKRFYGCSNYPKCKWASWYKPKDIDKASKTT